MAGRDDPLTEKDLLRFRELLIRLIFHIPAVESHQHGTDFDGQRISSEEFGRAVNRFRELPFNLYRVVFDPHDFEVDNETVTGSLADDLADIYRDLAVGIDNAINGHINDACFDWSQSYASHWFRHAVSALTAIEIFRTNY